MGILTAWQEEQIELRELRYSPVTLERRQFRGSFGKAYNARQRYLNNALGHHTKAGTATV